MMASRTSTFDTSALLYLAAQWVGGGAQLAPILQLTLLWTAGAAGHNVRDTRLAMLLCCVCVL